jgi:predicted transcriptional regulator/Mor family transcriptional regulator
MMTPEERQATVDLYATGKMQWEIGEILGFTQTAISQSLRKSGVKMRPRGKITYTDVNLDFFKEINSEASAYFLGFIYADGNVNKHMTSISITINKKDVAILEKFREMMSPTSKIQEWTQSCPSGKVSNVVRISINRKEVCEQLAKLGCSPNKSLTIRFPTRIPQHLMHHFLRGYSDGDGTIYSSASSRNKKHTVYYWNVIGSVAFTDTMATLLHDTVGVNIFKETMATKQPNQFIVKAGVGGNNQVEKVLDWLYKDATIYLQRKYDRYLDFKKYKASKPHIESRRLGFTEKQEQAIVNDYIAGMSSRMVGKKYGASKPSILDILRKHNVDIRSKVVPRMFDASTEQQMIDEYLKGKSTYTLGKEFGCSQTKANRVIQTAGVSRRVGKQRSVLCSV